MLERLRNKLEALGCDAWELTETRKRGWEFYFIRRALDQNRVVETKSALVRVYRKLEGGLLGSAAGTVSPTASDAELDRLLSGLMFQAGLVKNPAYTLTDRPVSLPERTERVDVEGIAEDFLRALRAVPETETEDINSCELFVSELTRRTRNSNGVAYACTYPSSMAEVVINARRDGREIELYRNFTSGACDGEGLKRALTQALRFGRDRLAAAPTPALGQADVVLSGRDAVEVYRYFADRMSAGFKVRRLSDWEAGQPVCAWTTGDRLSLEALPELENSSQNFPVDEEGSVIAPRFLIRDGVAERFWGSRQFSCYLGLEDSSLVYNFRAGGGTAEEQELLRGDCLELVEFSDFQIDPAGGDIAGEIRLGYWRHAGETRIVTGGSVSGSLAERAPSLRMSRGTARYDNWEIPKLTRIEGLRISGIEAV